MQLYNSIKSPLLIFCSQSTFIQAIIIVCVRYRLYSMAMRDEIQMKHDVLRNQVTFRTKPNIVLFQDSSLVDSMPYRKVEMRKSMIESTLKSGIMFY